MLRQEVVVTFKWYLLLLDFETKNILLELFLKLEAWLRYLLSHLFLNTMIRFSQSFFMPRSLPALLLRPLLPAYIGFLVLKLRFFDSNHEALLVLNPSSPSSMILKVACAPPICVTHQVSLHRVPSSSLDQGL